MKTGSQASPDCATSGAARARPPGVFVTGTGTGVGKSVVAAAIIAALTAAGHRVCAFKPAVSGLDEPDPTWPPDHKLLAVAGGDRQMPAEVAPYLFGPAVSPHLAAELAGVKIERAVLDGAFDRLRDGDCDAIVCEGVGGLLVPLSVEPPLSVLDLAVGWRLPAVVAAHPGLGTISDTRLAVDRLRAEGVEVLAVVLTPWPENPTTVQRSNRETIAELCDVEVYGLPVTTPGALAGAAATAGLPVGPWAGVGW